MYFVVPPAMDEDGVRGPGASEEVFGWMQFASTLRITQLSREINSETMTAAGLLAEIDRYCSEIRSSQIHAMTAENLELQRKICDSLIRKASGGEIVEGSNAFLRQKLANALDRLEEVKTNLRKVRRNSIMGEQAIDMIITPENERNNSRIDIGKYKKSNRLIDLRLPEGMVNNWDVNESLDKDKEWNKLLTGHPSPTHTANKNVQLELKNQFLKKSESSKEQSITKKPAQRPLEKQGRESKILTVDRFDRDAIADIEIQQQTAVRSSLV